MAKMFYTAAEAAERLGKTEDEIKELVRAGTLREFRDAGSVSYKVEEVDELLGGDSLIDLGSASASGEVVLEPAEDSGIELSPADDDILSLEEVDSADTSGGTTSIGGKEDTASRAKSDSVVPSVGINVFDDDELDESVDPLAQTAVTDLGGLGGLDGVGSGSGILDLTKESDDTSLGAELLEEIYSGEDADSGVEASEDTRAGAEPEAEEEAGEPFADDTATGIEGEQEAPAKAKAKPQAAAVVMVEEGGDAVSAALTAFMAVAVVVMWFAGLAGAALVRGVVPSLVKGAYANLLVCTAGALGVAVIAGGVTFVMARRSK